MTFQALQVAEPIAVTARSVAFALVIGATALMPAPLQKKGRGEVGVGALA
jgi:hypothetical protein